MALAFSNVLASHHTAQADPITYTETLTATGMIGGQAFTDAVILLTTIADTANITFQTIDGLPTYENAGITTIQIAGIGTATFTGGDDFGAISKDLSGFLPLTGLVGIGDLTQTLFVAGNFVMTPPLSDLSLPYTGTGTGTTSFGPFQTTTLGDLMITESIMGDGTFTATMVPEPAALTSAGLACLMVGAWTRARQRRARPRV